MLISFSKYQGAGNDFILIKDLENSFPDKDHKFIGDLCDRRFGIGADGLMLLRSSPDKDFTMLYFNANGHEGTMCGNGGRCLVAFARDCGFIQKDKGIIFDAVDGEHSAAIIRPGVVSLKMKDVSEIKKMGRGYHINTGSIHHVEYVDKLVDMDVCRRGRAIREHKMYAPDGCNVNFIKGDKEENIIAIRTYERGVEDETLACGTGSVAAAIVHHANGKKYDKYLIRARGGVLSVNLKYDKQIYHDIYLEGPATFVYKGEWQR
ncbi:MAG: diaminopimelate epimerase [Candidatus Marinimicrobia bacterium]|nr:diaminopimelate epimerase [Candidatus Neomarinimicrobiota bacterium]